MNHVIDQSKHECYPDEQYLSRFKTNSSTMTLHHHMDINHVWTEPPFPNNLAISESIWPDIFEQKMPGIVLDFPFLGIPAKDCEGNMGYVGYKFLGDCVLYQEKHFIRWVNNRRRFPFGPQQSIPK